MDIEHKLVETNMRCNCGMQYRSVVGMGRISFIATKEDKVEALNILMKHYTGQDHHYFEEKYINIRLDIDEISGKKCTY
jgi:nitroimidazol reductase NimA-like FMN-containing flavoprotein (pyridoxamine 5'-phosphate oxidase superfamily)